MSLKREWVRHCLDVSMEKADLYSGCRKILRNRTLSFYTLDDGLTLEDAGYTKSKMTHLTRGYLHPESKEVALRLWDRRRGQDKYGSVGLTTYNHFMKNDEFKKSKRASVMGPCIQALTVTLIKRDVYAIDCFYRTTELFKKFPADLVFIRDVLLKDFKFEGMRMEEMNCHFANITAHPMYFADVIPSMGTARAITFLEKVKDRDKYFFDWIVKWTARYICPEHHRGIAKFEQAKRVHMHINESMDKADVKELAQYVREHHPGHRNDYVEGTYRKS